jgi:hypothetical protein
METLRLKAKPVNRRIIIDLPPNIDADNVEIIVFAASKTPDKKYHRRTPPKELAGTILRDDLVAPAVPECEWDALQ